jgi:uncharacterized membrane protein YccF (DUF307 family)
MRMLGNLLWFILGGVIMGLAWWLAGLLAFITIIGIPFGIQHLKLAGIAIFPIGKTVVSTEVAMAARMGMRG